MSAGGATAWRLARIFAAVFLAGMVSLLMELSILREFMFVAGSTAAANSFIITLFLTGLAAGTYLGRLVSARRRLSPTTALALVQVANVATIVVFVLLKKTLIYDLRTPLSAFVCFGAVTVLPAAMGGMSFSLFVRLVYGEGERFIAHVYAVSTLGSVVAGLLHGFVLVAYFGMRSTYLAAALCAALTVSLLLPLRAGLALGALLLAICAIALPSNAFGPRRAGKVVYEHDDADGLVVALERGAPDDKRVDVFISNLYNCSTAKGDVGWKRASIETPVRMLGARPLRFLLLGYCSGESVTAALDSHPASTAHVVEIDSAVLRMAERLFPGNWARSRDPRVELTVGEFRHTLRFAPPGDRYDVVVIDVSVRDPYWHGLFTTEFFELVARHMTEDGILFIHDQPEFYPTLGQVFPFGYAHAPGPELERLIARATSEVAAQRFYSRRALSSEREAAAGVVRLADPPGGNIYTDERIQWSSLP